MAMKGKKIFVTGADGFIGSHLTEMLVREGARVKALVFHNAFSRWGWLDDLAPEILREAEIVDGDICDPDAMRILIKGSEIVFHLAALIAIPFSYIAPRAYVRVNIEGTINVLQAALQASVNRVVHTSTSEVYGSAQQIPMPETHPLNAQSPYAASKIAADQMALSIHRSLQAPVTILRLFNTYGARQSTRAVIPTIITQALKPGNKIILGDTRPTRDFLFVEDTVRAFLAIAEAPKVEGSIIGVGTGRETQIGEVVEHVGAILGKNLVVTQARHKVRPEKSEVTRLCCDASRARQLLGWQATTPLREGLAKTIEWFRTHPDVMRPDNQTWLS